MARKAFAIAITVIILVLYYFFGPSLLSDSYLEKRRVAEILSQGLTAQAKVIDKRIERLRNPAQGSNVVKLFVVLDYEGQINEQQFFKGTPDVRSEWEKVKIGDTVEIKVHPEQRSSFIAPDYLEKK